MKSFLVATIAIAALALGGCAGDTAIKATVADANIEYVRAQAVAAAKPLVDMKIPMAMPDGTYEVMEITLQNPGASNVRPLAMPSNEWAGVIRDSIKTVGTVGGVLAGGYSYNKMAETLMRGTAGILATQPAPTVVTQPAPIQFNQPEPTIVTQPKPTVVDPVIVTQPEPIVVDPVIVDQPEPIQFNQPEPTIVTRSVPTIVTQPEPVIVTQPAPTIVDPVIVNQPEPVIIDPVVVETEVLIPNE